MRRILQSCRSCSSTEQVGGKRRVEESRPELLSVVDRPPEKLGEGLALGGVRHLTLPGSEARGRVVQALLKLVNEPKAVGQVINIGNTQEITIEQLALRVRELAGSKSVIKFIPYDQAYESGFEDMPRRVPDLTKVTALIGYHPKNNLDDILMQVIDYFRKK